MLQLFGTVVNIERHELSENDAVRLELPNYYTCQIQLADGNGLVSVITSIVPKYWQWRQSTGSINEPASVAAVFVKRMQSSEAMSAAAASEPTALFVAKRIAWHPDGKGFPRVSVGKSTLGMLGMDVGLLDDVQSRGPIRAVEREAFYQMLSAAGKVQSNQLIRSAQSNLSETRALWLEELESAKEDEHRAMAREVIRRAEQGRYSVAPLFNVPQREIGELVVFDGVARRIVRVVVGSRPDGTGASDVAHRFGIREYYEMEVFTDDSQNYPLVFCVRELPPGMPTGGAVDVPVRVAGFFFKDWMYTTRGTRSVEDREVDPNASRAQFAPLLIGRGPVVLQIEHSSSQVTQWLLGGTFLLALAGIWATAWWFARGDRQFAARNRGATLSPPVGQFLKDLNVPDEILPMIEAGDAASNTSTSP
jgi:hypothetical protein